MKKKFLTIFMAVLCSVSSYTSFSQTYKSCATTDVHEENLKKDPSVEQNMKGIENHTKLYEMSGGANAKMMAITIPVVVHVIYNTAAQNISDAQILSQINALNEDFRKLNADASLIPSVWQNIAADAQIEFCLAKRDPLGNSTTGITRTYTNLTSFSTNNAMKYTSQGGKDIWDRNQYLNIWVCNMSGNIGGYAQFPGGTASTDGVVVHYSTFGTTGNLLTGYNKGRVTTHEVGHWLNLRHIWGDAACGNDYVADTPPQQGANYGCPSFPYVTCSNGPSGDMFMNYMDYTLDACKYMFTNGQSARMNAVLAPGGFRFSLTSSLGCVPPGTSAICNIPAGLNASVSSTSAILMWNSTGALSYNVRIKEISSSTWTSSNTAMTSSNVSGLNPGTTYEFQVQSVCSSSSSAFSNSYTFTTPASICNTPTGLAVTNISSSFVTLTWNSSGANTYIIRYKPTSGVTWTNASTSQTTISIGGLSAGITYEVQVQGICSSSSSVFSNSVTFTIPVVCNPVTTLNTSNVTANSATLSWNNSGAASYNVRYKTTSSPTWNNLNTSQTSVTITGLSSGTAYEFQVQSVCSGVTSIFSESATFTTLVPVCNAPTGLTATNITTFSATLSWNNTGAASYYFRYKPISSNTWSTLLTTLTSVSINGLIAGTTYDFQVQSVCSSSSSPYSPSFTFTTAVSSCNVPSGLIVSGITLNSATLTWNNAGANSYIVRYKSTSSSSWINTSTSQTSVNIAGLSPGTDYEFQVQSVCSSTSSSFSSSVIFSTVTSCDAPINLIATNITTSTAVLSWNGTNANSYNVRYKQTSGTTWTNLSTIQTNISISGLASGTAYEFQVQSACSSSSSLFSNSSTFTTMIPACNVPSGLSATNITTSSVTLLWNSTGATSYYLRYKPVSYSVWNNVITTQASVNLAGLTAGMNYEFQVQSVCGSLFSGYSNSAQFTTTIGCSVPTGLTVGNITNTTANLSWNSTDADSYYVKYRITTSFSWSYFQTYLTSVNIAGLIEGTNYEFQVQSVCGSANSAYSSSVYFTTTGALCTMPSGLGAANITETTATLTWNNTGAASYTVNYKTSMANAWNTVSTSQTSINIASLLPNTNYEFRVQSNCGSYSSAFSNLYQFSTISGSPSNVITVGNGTSTSELPYGTAFLDQKAQFFVSKAELDAAGFNLSNNRLTSLAFYVTNASNEVMNNFTIKIAHITTSAFAYNFFINTFGATTVFNGNVTAVSNSWNVHNFDVPFVYNGINNLLIEICFDNNSASTNSMVRYSFTQQPTVLYSQQNILNTGICNTYQGTLTYNRPNMQLAFSGGSNRISAESVIEVADENSLSVYPNPATTAATINFVLNEADENCSVELFNIGGGLVYSETIRGREGLNKYEINFDSNNKAISSGLYFVRVITTRKEFFSKLLIN